MEQLNFHAKKTTRSKSTPNGCDFWIRSSVNEKSGVKIKYLALAQKFIHGPHESNHDGNELNVVVVGDNMVKNYEVHVAIDVRSRVLVGNVTPELVGADAVKNFKSRRKTAFYHSSASLVDDIINEMKLDTTKTNHYFKLFRDGSFHELPRFKIVEI